MGDDQIRENHGDSWCICMWATARLISEAGCDNVHLNCAATDVSYVMEAYNDGGTDLHPAHECLKRKCPAAAGTQSKFLLPSKADDGLTLVQKTVAQSGTVGLVLMVLSLGSVLVYLARARAFGRIAANGLGDRLDVEQDGGVASDDQCELSENVE